MNLIYFEACFLNDFQQGVLLVEARYAVECVNGIVLPLISFFLCLLELKKIDFLEFLRTYGSFRAYFGSRHINA